ncbi:hypothetical protein [Corynebacterium lubricantis]|uniref:hypothetical protein n=1 Tax=Corynebacterium lubricantis TaxID=541095 RepID=UPI00036E62E4|nr:hypothetical protein [Corynebacterium lubricantis]
MKVHLPTDCGNAPRIQIVGQFATDWAGQQLDQVTDWLHEEIVWEIVGEKTHEGPAAANEALPGEVPEELNVNAIITHGRLASCDGTLVYPNKVIEFSHVFRFASTGKTAKIKSIRTYLVEAAE